MTEWVATSFGVLDVAESPDFEAAELIVLPTIPSIPLALPPVGADLWRRLVERPVADAELTEDERAVVREMRGAGLASPNPGDPARWNDISSPWMSSPMHELVYALVQNVARRHGIPLVFIKGPMLHAQGLRDREHSGDVDVWVEPDRIDDFIAAMEPWGWRLQPDLWSGLPINHSLTLEPAAGWGCEIDVHRRMPGLGLTDAAAFSVVRAHTTPVEFAGVVSSTPRREVNAVLSALHAVRPEIGHMTPRSAHERAVAVLSAGGDGVRDAAMTIDAVVALHDDIVEAFPQSTLDVASAGTPRDWAWRAQPTKARAYLVALKEVPWLRRPLVAFRLFWPSREVVQASERHVGEISHGALQARVHRLRRGIADVMRRPRNVQR
ncbi:nucleotidyltransferase family protein [Microbacterium sp. No. 7]|uniref:nucleotidyltransferase family protein n=1 Tax=Microbacterium sp. No. 7 TaxID=1714373 RepID=UPI0006D0F655|nr:nucleotidyltransferase family protein [Microbacterium sp. No. 7]ALJ19042.1 hypothetical protein AOA12_03625 [Microbacterium sp. No. 7]